MTSPTCPLPLQSCTYGSEKTWIFHFGTIKYWHTYATFCSAMQIWVSWQGRRGGAKVEEEVVVGLGAQSFCLSGADVTVSQSVVSWFIYRCMNMWKHLSKLNLCERGSRPSNWETTTSLKMKPPPALTPLTHCWRAWTSHIRVKCWCSSSGRWDGGTLAR